MQFGQYIDFGLPFLISSNPSCHFSKGFKSKIFEKIYSNISFHFDAELWGINVKID